MIVRHVHPLNGLLNGRNRWKFVLGRANCIFKIMGDRSYNEEVSIYINVGKKHIATVKVIVEGHTLLMDAYMHVCKARLECAISEVERTLV